MSDRTAILRADPGLAASPPLRYTLKWEEDCAFPLVHHGERPDATSRACTPKTTKAHEVQRPGDRQRPGRRRRPERRTRTALMPAFVSGATGWGNTQLRCQVVRRGARLY